MGRLVVILIIILIIIALLYLSFALFKGDWEDGKIGVNVVTGKCKIDIQDTDGQSIIGDVLDFVPLEGEENVIFQPGATYYTEGFKIKNEGNISLNYRVYINESERDEKDKFEEAFELWITKDITNLESAEKLTSFKDALSVNQTSDTYYLVAKMKEAAGNEFQDKIYTGIGITVYAIQSNAPME